MNPSTITVPATALRAGDRVRATFPLGIGPAVVEGTVAVSGGIPYLRGVIPRLARAERIERVEPPLPTKPGIYLPYAYGADTPNVWRLDPRGKWLAMPNLEDHSVYVLRESDVRDALGTMVYLGDGTDSPKAVAQ